MTGMAPQDWLRGDGEMVRRIKEHSWEATPLGTIERWPQSLKTTVGLMLASGHAMQIAWGPERTILYNEAYAPMLGARHPTALGLPFREAWPDVWEEIEPLVGRVFAGETVRFENMPLVMTRRGFREDTWWNFSYSPVRDEAGAVAGLLNVTVDATARVRAERAERERDDANARLRASELRFRALVTAGAQSIYRMSPDWRVMQELDSGTLANTSEPLENWSEKYILDEDRPPVFAAIERAIRTRSLFELEHRVRLADGSIGWVLSRAVPLMASSGEIVEWFGAGSDVTDRKRAESELRKSEERLRLLVAELQHRTRNLLGVVRAMADRTGEASADFPDFRYRFADRLMALARVQRLLSRLEETDRVAFDELIHSELEAMGGVAERVTLDGPAGIRLRSSMVQTLALAIHELATNAVKYGALGQPEARLAISWRMVTPDESGRPRLHVDWRETGVAMPPAGAAAQGSGQGRELIEEALPYQLDAETTFQLGPDGVHCTITMPVSESNVSGRNAMEPAHG